MTLHAAARHTDRRTRNLRIAVRHFFFATVALALLVTVIPSTAAIYGTNAAQPKKPAEPEPPFVIRLVSAQRARYQGYDVLTVNGVGAMDGKQVQMGVQNTDMNSNKYDPKADVAGVVNGAKPGDYVRVEVDRKDRQVWIKKAAAYKVSPGEEQPGTFVFDESYTKGDRGSQLAVRMSKFGTFVEAIVAQKRNDAKQLVTDESLAAKVNAYKKGDVIEAEVQGGTPPTLAAVDLYKAPEEARFQKLVDIEVDGQKYPAVELDQDGKPVSLPLTGKVVSKKLTADPKLASAARALRAGTVVLFKTTEDGGKTYLKEIHAAPKQPAKADAKTGSGGKPDMKAEGKTAGK